MPDLPDRWSVVSDNEFSMLSLLPSFSKNGDVLTRSDRGKDYFVIRQSEYDRIAMLARSIDFECDLVMDAKFAELAEPEIKPVTVTPAIPEVDRAVAERPAIIQPGNRLQGGLDINTLFCR